MVNSAYITDLRAIDGYLPVAAVNRANFVAEIAGRRYRMQGGGSFAIQPPAPADDREMARLVKGWDYLNDWEILTGGEGEEILTVKLDLDGARRWRPRVRERFGIRP
jgi:predicted amidohydrolase